MLTTNRKEYKAGETIVVTSGEYSDYHIKGVFVVEKDFTLDECCYTATGITGKSVYKYIDLPKAIAERLLTEIDVTEVWDGR